MQSNVVQQWKAFKATMAKQAIGLAVRNSPCSYNGVESVVSCLACRKGVEVALHGQPANMGWSPWTRHLRNMT